MVSRCGSALWVTPRIYFLYRLAMNERFVAGAHFYDPPRSTYHEKFQGVSTDPLGENWLVNVYKRAYRPLMDSGTLELLSFDVNQVLLHEMEREGLSCAGFTKGRADNVIGTSYIHPILPDLTQNDKRIVIGAGIQSYRQEFGKDPTIFWPPEAAMDEATARVLVEYGYQAFVCAPWQVQSEYGGDSDNRPMRIQLSGGGSIIAIPYDAELSNHLAFGDKSNADRFRDNFVGPKTLDNSIIVTWVDGETYGHHAPFGDLFLSYLLTRSLPEIGVQPIPH